jgi:hypothetical protein
VHSRHLRIARASLEAAGCRSVFRPTALPDFTPIQQVSAKAGQRLRRMQARIFDMVVAAAGTTLATTKPRDSAGFFRVTACEA